jgi:hypothetical protein
MIVSRMDQQIISCWFQAQRELTPQEIAREIDKDELLSDVGIRFMPDWATPGGPPLVHDLVLRAMGEGSISKAWAGEANLQLGDAPSEELDLLRPLEMLPSHFIHLQYQSGPGVARLLHDYVERRTEDDRVVRRITSTMGEHLRGSSPPFTPSGRAAFMSSMDLGTHDGQFLAQAGHIGLLLRWRADRANAERLLPPPLAPSEHTDRIYLFLNRTQSGINIHQDDAEGLEYLKTLNPNHSTWHEALFLIPCLCEGERSVYIPIQYKDQDHAIPLGMFDGMPTKLASFHETFPFGPQPLNSHMTAGGVARMTVSRFDERLITAEFTAGDEVPHDALREHIDLDELLNDSGIRYWPDYARVGAPPLVHDLVMWDMVGGDIPVAWRGTAALRFGTSPYEELDLLQPLEMLESYFIHLEYRAGPGVVRVIHDYVVEPVAE